MWVLLLLRPQTLKAEETDLDILAEELREEEGRSPEDIYEFEPLSS